MNLLRKLKLHMQGRRAAFNPVDQGRQKATVFKYDRTTGKYIVSRGGGQSELLGSSSTGAIGIGGTVAARGNSIDTMPTVPRVEAPVVTLAAPRLNVSGTSVFYRMDYADRSEIWMAEGLKRVLIKSYPYFQVELGDLVPRTHIGGTDRSTLPVPSGIVDGQLVIGGRIGAYFVRDSTNDSTTHGISRFQAYGRVLADLPVSLTTVSQSRTVTATTDMTSFSASATDTAADDGSGTGNGSVSYDARGNSIFSAPAGDYAASASLSPPTGNRVDVMQVSFVDPHDYELELPFYDFNTSSVLPIADNLIAHDLSVESIAGSLPISESYDRGFTSIATAPLGSYESTGVMVNYAVSDSDSIPAGSSQSFSASASLLGLSLRHRPIIAANKSTDARYVYVEYFDQATLVQKRDYITIGNDLTSTVQTVDYPNTPTPAPDDENHPFITKKLLPTDPDDLKGTGLISGFPKAPDYLRSTNVVSIEFDSADLSVQKGVLIELNKTVDGVAAGTIQANGLGLTPSKILAVVEQHPGV